MGNRAVITTSVNLNETGIYLHWNGGRASVEAFLAYCKLKGYRCPEDDCYGWAYLCGVITNTIGSGISVGIDGCEYLDTNNYDNGTYIIENWLITDRMFMNRNCEQDDYDLLDCIKEIDDRQPEHMRLSEDEWKTFDTVKQAVIDARINCKYIGE
jgi:hypothetical protein